MQDGAFPLSNSCHWEARKWIIEMDNRIKRTLLALLVTLPLAFALIFFGYFPLHYDLVIQTDNIVGEGICISYGSRVDEHISVNGVSFYFGSELKEATIKNFFYDVDALYLLTSDVSAFDITGIDSYIHGIHLKHFNAEDILPDGETMEGTNAVLASHDGALHIEVRDPHEGATLRISQPFIPLWFWGAYIAAIILLALVLAALVSFVLIRFPVMCLPLMQAACIAVTILAGSFFCGSLSYMKYVNFLLNWLLLMALSLAVNAITVPCFGTIMTMAFTSFWYIANYFVIILRGKPIMPADLKAIGTAAEVMGGYTFVPSGKMIVGVLLVLCYAVLLIHIFKQSRLQQHTPHRFQLMRRGAYLTAAVLFTVIAVNTNTFKNLNSFAWDTALTRSFHEEGMVLSYLKSVINSRVKEPEGYSRDLINSYLAEYKGAPHKEENTVRPTRIIMIMNEAFSDLRTVGLNPAIDVMPFIDSLDENTVEGSLFVSVFGGGTCNTEFEALTGNTLAFLGAGAYPYTENVTKPVFSLASYFRQNGYLVEAFHANEADNWNRNMVYPNLGFDVFHSIADYEAGGYVVNLHDNPADISDYHFIEDVDREKSDQPRFLFDVTMQNHSPYERWLDVDRAESVTENGSELYVDTQVYLSLIKASDDEVKQLVDTYSDSDEPTMIIFFGDHQPGLPGTAVNEIYTALNANIDLYKSKFFIWTNYDIQEWHNAVISANYLPWLILERGNFPLPPYLQMLGELYEKYPIISAQGVMDIEGNVYTGIAEVMDDPLIQKYQYIQYANLFDEIDPAWFEVQ